MVCGQFWWASKTRHHPTPIQVKQKDKAGRPEIDSFEAVMTRENQGRLGAAPSLLRVVRLQLRRHERDRKPLTLPSPPPRGRG